MNRRIFSLPFDEALGRTAERTPELGGGPTAAMTCASAAALVMMAARHAGDVGEAIVADLEPLLEALAKLADADGPAFAELLAAWRLPADEPSRAEAVAAGALLACSVPLRVAAIGARVCEHACFLVGNGTPDLVGDALTAAFLADAGVQSSACLVRLNARQVTEGDPVAEVAALATTSRELISALPAI